MEKIGLKNKAAVIVENIYNSTKFIHEFDGWEYFTKSQNNALQYFIDARKSGNIENIIDAESFFLEQEFKVFKGNTTVAASLSAAQENLRKMRKILPLVVESSGYRKIAETYLQKDCDKSGLPYDAFRKSVTAHIARLGNSQREYRISDEERKVIDQRQINMRMVESMYIALQKQALGLKKPKEKEHGIGR